MAQSDDYSQAAGLKRVFLALSIAVLTGLIAYVGRSIIIPVIVATFLSFLIFTLKQSVLNLPAVGRFFPGWLAYILAFAAIGSLFIVFIEIIRSNADALIEAAPLYQNRLQQISQDAIASVKELGFIPAEFVGGFDSARSRALSMIDPFLREFGSSVRSLASSSITIFLYTIFMLLERGRIFKKINIVSSGHGQQEAVNETITEIGELIKQYITVKTVTNLITASISFTIMYFIGVDFAGFWALLIFILNYIPIVGAVTAISLPVTLLLVQPEGGGVQQALLALGLLVGAEQTMSSAIEPRLIGRTLNLSPLVILLSLAVWGAIWGFAGMLLAVPITVTVMIFLTQFESTRPIAIFLSDNGQIAKINQGKLSA